jgi:hypothetical protein
MKLVNWEEVPQLQATPTMEQMLLFSHGGAALRSSNPCKMNGRRRRKIGRLRWSTTLAEAACDSWKVK